MDHRSFAEQLKNLKRELWVYKVTLLTIVVSGAVFFMIKTYPPLVNIMQAWKEERRKKETIPYYDQIMEILQPLRYSGLQALIRPDVQFDMDFDRKLWYIHNIHHFDSNGNIILEEGHDGVCGELSAYVYGRIKPLVGRTYDIKFVRVSESGFFLTPKSTHIVLLIQKKRFLGASTYLLDPSFQRYGKKEDFDDYYFFDSFDYPPFLVYRYPDVFFDIDHGTPILIRHNFLVTLEIGSSDGRFDRDNFIVSLTATERDKFAGRYILALRNHEGKAELFENSMLLKQIFDLQDYEPLRAKLIHFFKQYNNNINL